MFARRPEHGIGNALVGGTREPQPSALMNSTTVFDETTTPGHLPGSAVIRA